MKTMRPELDQDSQWLMDQFLKQELYSNQKEVIKAALEALFEKHMIEESKNWDENSATSEDVIYSQIKDEDRRNL